MTPPVAPRMRSAFPSLVRLYFNSVYGIKPLSEYRKPKDWLKLAGISLLFLLILARKCLNKLLYPSTVKVSALDWTCLLFGTNFSYAFQ